VLIGAAIVLRVADLHARDPRRCQVALYYLKKRKPDTALA
jgi:hypothetical protein